MEGRSQEKEMEGRQEREEEDAISPASSKAKLAGGWRQTGKYCKCVGNVLNAGPIHAH